MINKNVMAVAVAAALAAPVAAFAQASNVQIYGTIDMSVEQVWLKSTTVATVNSAAAASPVVGGQGKNDLYSQSSRLGFKGTEDLGNGLKAWFQVESGLGMGRDNGMTNALAGRNSAVGLEGGFGNVFIGHWDTPYKNAMTSVMGNYGGGWLQHNGMLLGGGTDSTGTLPNNGCDNMGASQNANISSVATNCGQVEGNGTSFHRRVTNVMQYWTPRMSGVQGKFAYVGNGTKSDSTTNIAPTLGSPAVQPNSPTLFSMDLNYAAGPLTAGIAHERHNGFRATGTWSNAPSATGAVATATSLSTNNAAQDTATQIYGSYDFGAVKIQANYESLSYGDTAIATAAAPGVTLGGNNFKRDAWFLGASAPIGNGRVFGGYSTTSGNKSCGSLGVNTANTANTQGAGVINNITATTSANFFCGGDTGSTAYTLGYEYSLSKRTSVYTTYMNVDNKQYASFQPVVAKAGVNGAGLGAGLTGQDMSAINMGMKHSF